MPVSAKAAQLIAINEALRCLDRDSVGLTDCDGLIDDALAILLEARLRLTSKPWPERAPIPASERDAWLDARAAEQLKDGRL